MKPRSCLVVCFLLSICWQAEAAPVLTNVVLAGDSQTKNGITNFGYEDEFATLVANYPMFTSMAFGVPGLTGSAFVTGGHAGDVVNATPNFVVLMLGINDALKGSTPAFPNRSEDAYDLWRGGISGGLDLIDGSTATNVIILSILPIDETAPQFNGQIDGPGTNLRLTGDGTNTNDPETLTFGYNPWLEREVGLRNTANAGGAGPTYEYIDLFTGFDTNLLDPDGLHLTGAGQQWLANRVGSAVGIPEPSSFLFLAMTGGVVISLRRRHRR